MAYFNLLEFTLNSTSFALNFLFQKVFALIDILLFIFNSFLNLIYTLYNIASQIHGLSYLLLFLLQFIIPILNIINIFFQFAEDVKHFGNFIGKKIYNYLYKSYLNHKNDSTYTIFTKIILFIMILCLIDIAYNAKHVFNLLMIRFYDYTLPELRVKVVSIEKWVKLAFTFCGPTLAPDLKSRFFANTGWCLVVIAIASFLILLLVVARLNKNNIIIWLLALPTILLTLFWKLFKYDLYADHTVQAISKIKKENPQFFDFLNSQFKQSFDLFIGRGRIYHNAPEIANFDSSKIDIGLLDPTNQCALQGVDPDLIAYQIKQIFLQRIEPLLGIVEDMENGNIPLKRLLYKFNPPVKSIDLLTTDTTKFMPREEGFIYDSSVFINNFITNHLGSALISIVLLITIILTLLYTLSFFTSTSAKDYEKLSAYECGFEPIHSNARIKFDVIYWIIGILYLIFDLELIFIFPFATILHNLQNPIALLVYLIFIIVLTLGFIYEWKKGALKLNL